VLYLGSLCTLHCVDPAQRTIQIIYTPSKVTNVDLKKNSELRGKLSTQRKPMNSKQKHKHSHYLRTCIFPPPYVFAFHFPGVIGKYPILRSRVSNGNVALRIMYMAADISAQASRNKSMTLFTAWWMIGMALVPIVVL
jgi:hypothetical protein